MALTEWAIIDGRCAMNGVDPRLWTLRRVLNVAEALLVEVVPAGSRNAWRDEILNSPALPELPDSTLVSEQRRPTKPVNAEWDPDTPPPWWPAPSVIEQQQRARLQGMRSGSSRD